MSLKTLTMETQTTSQNQEGLMSKSEGKTVKDQAQWIHS